MMHAKILLRHTFREREEEGARRGVRVRLDVAGGGRALVVAVGVPVERRAADRAVEVVRLEVGRVAVVALCHRQGDTPRSDAFGWKRRGAWLNPRPETEICGEMPMNPLALN